MPPIRLNRRRFLGASAAAGWALSQGRVKGSMAPAPVRVGVIGLGTRGTALLRTLLELDGAQVVALCDSEGRHLARASGIVEKARGARPDATERIGQVLERPDIDALVVALPCDLHASTYRDALLAGKHLYGEKPLALTLAECSMIEAEAARSPGLVVHVGYQRRSNPRYREGVALARRGDLGPLVSGSADWISSNGPMNGHGHWLASRARSGDWMLEQAVHVWDVFGWLKGAPPARAFGHGRRDLFARLQPARDVTDDYSAHLEWADGFRVSFAHSWVAPADDAFTGVSQRVVGEEGGLDLASGSVTYREKARPRQAIHPGPQPDTRLALQASSRPSAPSTRGPRRSPWPRPARPPPSASWSARPSNERRVVTWDEILSGG